MNEQECLARMVAPGTRRPGKYRQGVIQILVTRACDKCCFGCTQGSNLAGEPRHMSVEHFEQAVESLRGYFGVVGVFGGNPALHPEFFKLCDVLQHSWAPREQRGIWCNNPINLERARKMAETFNSEVSNLNVHLDKKAYMLFRVGWPSCSPVGLTQDSRHSPPFVAMKDVLRKECPARCGKNVHCVLCQGTGWVYDEELAHELISGCDINQHWSALIGTFRGELRAWFCEVAGAQAMLHQDEPDYPDTGYDLERTISFREKQPLVLDKRLAWWELPMSSFRDQVRKHCHECGVPLRGRGELAMAPLGIEQTSRTHEGVYRPKRVGRRVEVVTERVQLGLPLGNVVRYLQNAGT